MVVIQEHRELSLALMTNHDLVALPLHLLPNDEIYRAFLEGKEMIESEQVLVSSKFFFLFQMCTCMQLF